MKRPWMTCTALAVCSLCLDVHGDINPKDIAGREWPGHNPEFSGPGNPDEIAAAALDFLRKNPNWSKPEYDDAHTPYAACVTSSDWAVSKMAPLTHQPTQYSINVLVAFTGEKDPDIAYVYHMVFYTRDEAGVEKGLPLRYANSRQYEKYKIPLDMIPSKGGGGGSWLWRLLLGLGLVAGGLSATRDLLAGRLPPLKAVTPILGRLALPLGGALAVLGLGGFLCNLARLCPHASILPQLVAIALGIVLLRSSVGRKAPASAPPEAATGSDPAPPEPPGPAAVLSKFAFLDPLQVPLGLAALILGILHLALGGLGLV